MIYIYLGPYRVHCSSSASHSRQGLYPDLSFYFILIILVAFSVTVDLPQ